MFPTSEPQLSPDDRTGFRDAADLMEAVRKALDACKTPEVQHVLSSDAVLKATKYDNIDGRLPVVPERIGIHTLQAIPKPQSATAWDDQALREDLLANDSLGG